MKPNYGSFLSYYHFYTGDYITLDNGAEEPILGYGATLVQLGVKLIDTRDDFHIPGLAPPILSVTIP